MLDWAKIRLIICNSRCCKKQAITLSHNVVCLDTAYYAIPGIIFVEAALAGSKNKFFLVVVDYFWL